MLSQVVDSEAVFGTEETSSSLVTVDEDEAPRSGEDTFEASAGCEGFGATEAGCSVRASRATEGCSECDSASTSSAQLAGEALASGPETLVASLAGVAEPDAGLLVLVGVEMPFAACAYENVDAIANFLFVSRLKSDW